MFWILILSFFTRTKNQLNRCSPYIYALIRFLQLSVVCKDSLFRYILSISTRFFHKKNSHILMHLKFPFLINSFMMTWVVWRNNLLVFRVLFRHKKIYRFFPVEYQSDASHESFHSWYCLFIFHIISSFTFSWVNPINGQATT